MLSIKPYEYEGGGRTEKEENGKEKGGEEEEGMEVGEKGREERRNINND